ncbi:ABC transporter ATP-binding protein [Halioxenophilus sp. WMMB6]|uniref:ABC transporter ATP-binding protein n=1 Tax=Halioxenophilus sp. WMMB6 TaxID=3073815 RepID=UPI00295F2B1F|nr:ABC transporter ATP-binding protein [Halioxenophilus sp. WMMB6]
MNPVIQLNNLIKRHGAHTVVDIDELQIQPGKIVGLIGPNGAGKTSALRCILGLASYEGELSVLGKNPYRQRPELMREVAFIADTAVLPRWITAGQLLDYMAGIHPSFNRKKAEGFLAATNIRAGARVRTLSKGMITQLHLALIVAIEAKLLLLDEPTLGLDIIYRQRFYEQLLNDYYDESRTIIITTHQVEEVEQILTDLLFIKDGKLVLNCTLDEIPERFFEVNVEAEQVEEARRLNPIFERVVFGSHIMMFEGGEQTDLANLGSVRTPNIANLFVAKLGDGKMEVV